jgi:hypothetical protein
MDCARKMRTPARPIPITALHKYNGSIFRTSRSMSEHTRDLEAEGIQCRSYAQPLNHQKLNVVPN